jgi:lipopolysaccharide transport system ATP-binding protein
MSSESLAITIQELGKRYEIYERPKDRLKQMLLPRLQDATGMKRRQYFREFWALRDISLDVRRGETVGIIGRNGSGKSTLLQLVCGTLHPTMGRVRAFGRIAALLELGAGFNPEFTGRENVFLSGLLYGISEAELRKRYDKIVAFAEIGDFINQPVKTYSSGMYVRLAFAIAAHVDADTLIVDEALSVGDVRFTQKCMRFLRKFQERGTLLFVSHDSGAVTSLCDRAVWLDGGHMRMDGPARDVVEHYLAEQHAQDRSVAGDRVEVRFTGAPKIKSANESQEATAEIKVKKRQVSVDDGMDCRGEHAPDVTVEVFSFEPDTERHDFGAGDARIQRVALLDEHGEERKLIHGGELVDLVIDASVAKDLERPIFGFYVKDRLGQRLFGDNTYLSYEERVVNAKPGEGLRARFRFRMPVLPVGPYSIDVALATGTQEDHTQQHWIHDALDFRATESSMRTGLVGIPMLDIKIEVGGEAQ